MIGCPNCAHRFRITEASVDIGDHGYRIDSGNYGPGLNPGYVLQQFDEVDGEWHDLQTEPHGGVSPRRIDCVIEALRRIEADERVRKTILR